MSAQLESSEAAILSRVIQPDSGDWPQAAAEAILRIGFNETDRERMQQLADRSESGTLTDEERTEFDSYLHIGNLIAVMQSKARLVLRRNTRNEPLS